MTVAKIVCPKCNSLLHGCMDCGFTGQVDAPDAARSNVPGTVSRLFQCQIVLGDQHDLDFLIGETVIIDSVSPAAPAELRVNGRGVRPAVVCLVSVMQIN